MTDWFVLNARDAPWLDGDLGKYCNFEPEGVKFAELGINLNLLAPGEPMTMYHREPGQEGFLVLDGECLLVVEGEERALRKWDYFHCPANVTHAIVGAGSGPSLVLAIGSRTAEPGVLYPVDPVAQKHGTGVAVETSLPKEAYAPFSWRDTAYTEGWLPE
jgi:uncharacterized cupin superfamily protein